MLLYVQKTADTHKYNVHFKVYAIALTPRKNSLKFVSMYVILIIAKLLIK